MGNKIFVFLMVSLTLITFVSARGLIVPDDLIPTTPTNYSLIPTVNSSDFWDSLDTPTDIFTGDLTDDNTYVEVAGDTMTGDLILRDTGDNSDITIQSGGVNLNASIIFEEMGLDRWSLLFSGDDNHFYLWNNAFDSPTMRAHINTNEINFYNNVTTGGSLLPETTLTHDIGSGPFRWRNIYATNLSIDNVDASESITALGNITGDYFYGSGAYLSELNVTGNISVVGDIDISGYSLTASYLKGIVGGIDMRGDPWYFGGSDWEFANSVDIDENLNVDGNITGVDWITATNLNVTGNAYIGDFIFEGNLDMGGNNITNTGSYFIGDSLLNSTHIIDHDGHSIKDTFNHIINRGVAETITVSLTGGLDVEWTAGEVYDASTHLFVTTDAGSGTLTSDQINYLKYTGTSTLELQTSSSTGDEILISRFANWDNIIAGYREMSLLDNSLSDTRRGLRIAFPNRITGGMSVHEDEDVTNDLDVSMDAGQMIKDGIKEVNPTAIDSRTLPLVRLFHSGGDWTNDTNAEIDTLQYDNGTDLVNIPANKWTKGYFIYAHHELGWIYPTVYYNTKAQAEEGALSPIPPGLALTPKLTTVIYQQGDTDFDNAEWQDVRPGISEESFSVVSDHGSLAGLSDDDHPQYLLADGSRNLTGEWNVQGNFSNVSYINPYGETTNFGGIVVFNNSIYVTGTYINSNEIKFNDTLNFLQTKDKLTIRGNSTDDTEVVIRGTLNVTGTTYLGNMTFDGNLNMDGNNITSVNKIEVIDWSNLTDQFNSSWSSNYNSTYDAKYGNGDDANLSSLNVTNNITANYLFSNIDIKDGRKIYIGTEGAFIDNTGDGFTTRLTFDGGVDLPIQFQNLTEFFFSDDDDMEFQFWGSGTRTLSLKNKPTEKANLNLSYGDLEVNGSINGLNLALDGVGIYEISARGNTLRGESNIILSGNDNTLTLINDDITLDGGGNTLTLTDDATLNQDVTTTSNPTFNDTTVNKLTLTPAFQDYLFTDRGASTALALISQDSGYGFSFEGFTKDSDRTDSIAYRLWGWSSGGSASVTNSEYIDFQWNAPAQEYILSSKALGTGTLRPFQIRVGNTNVNQIRLTSGGEVFMAQAVDDALSNLRATYWDSSTGQLGYDSSSIRFKENIENVSSEVSDKIDNLRPVIYDKINGSEDRIGLIAEEVNELFPQCVFYDREPIMGTCIEEIDNSTYECVKSYKLKINKTTGEYIPQGINYECLISPLIQSVKDSNEKIENLETENQMLKNSLCLIDDCKNKFSWCGCLDLG